MACFVLPVCSAGGPWLITDMERMESIFELEPVLQVSKGNISYTGQFLMTSGLWPSCLHPESDWPLIWGGAIK